MRKNNGKLTSVIINSSVTNIFAETLCNKIGPRPICSPAMKTASEFTAEQFDAMGLSKVRLEKLPLQKWVQGQSVFEVADSPVFHKQFSFVKNCNIDGELVYAGFGMPEDMEKLGRRIKGSILLIKYGSPKKYNPAWGYRDKVLLAHEFGAKGAVFISNYPGNSIMPYGGRMENGYCIMPVVAIAQDDGEILARNYNGKKARLRFKNSGIIDGNCFNVAGDIGGSGSGNYVLVTAHLDSLYHVPGGLDNVTGVACIAETANVLARFAEKLKIKIRFVALTAEEEGLGGAVGYVKSHRKELDNIILQINCDTIFYETSIGLGVNYAPELVPYFQKILDESGCKVSVREIPSVSSDYMPFAVCGVPTVRPADFWGRMPPWSHTYYDNADKVEIKNVKNTAVYLSQLLYNIGMNPDTFPGRRRTKREIMEQFKRWDVDKLPSIKALIKEVGFEK